jgi:hypothetical protein
MQPDQTKTGMPDMRKSEARELLKKAKDRYKVMAEFDHENRQEGMEDLKFINVPGEQWDENMKQERGQRPCFEFNKTRISVKRVINDMRANRPGAKVRAVEDADTEVADIYEGLIRNIAEQSDFDTVVDYEAEYQVGAGMCAWRINTQYTQDDAFNQDIIIEPLRNPFTAYCDPQARDILKRDARDWCITEKIAKSNFEERWPDAEVIEFDPGEGDEYDDEGDWTSEKTVRIAEYWYKKPVKKEIWECIFLDEQTGESKTLIVDSTTDEAPPHDQQPRDPLVHRQRRSHSGERQVGRA